MSTHKRKRPIDVNLPNNIEEIIPESLFYKRLQEAEKKIDATISRKNITIQELLSKPIRVRKILRIFISNYATQQTHPLNDSVRNQALPNSWTLRIEGRLLDSQEKPSNVNKKFSHFVKQVVVEIDNDPNFYSEPNFAEYYKEVGKEVDFDGIEVKRKGNADVPVKIVIRLDFGPEKFKLSKELDQIVMHDIGGPSKIGIDQLLTKSEVVLAIWQYIKQHKLFDVDDKKYVNCDLTLRNLFGLEKILFAQIPDQINRYLLPADPIVIHYIVKVDKEYSPPKYAYDIEVEVDDLPKIHKLQSLLNQTTKNKEIRDLEDRISATLTTLNHHRLKREFLLTFSQDPVRFMEHFIASQARDLETMVNGVRANQDEIRNAAFYQQPWVKDAVVQYLTSKYRAS